MTQDIQAFKYEGENAAILIMVFRRFRKFVTHLNQVC